MTDKKQYKTYGAWPSPITAELVAGQSLRFGLVRVSGEAIYWTEGRPAEEGRSVIMRKQGDGQPEELLLAPYSARSRVHEYGGGEFLVASEGVYFVNGADQDIYCIGQARKVDKVTNEERWRFADFCIDRRCNRLISVGEYHERDHDPCPMNALVSVAVSGKLAGRVDQIVTGADFYAAPQISPDGTKIAWLQWNLPDMPWDSACIMYAEISDAGTIKAPVQVAGGNGSAAFQPQWADDGMLYFIWDVSGSGQLYRWDGDGAEQLFNENAEFGLALWGLGARSFALLEGNKAFLTCFFDGKSRVALADLTNRTLSWLETGLANIYGPVRSSRGVAALVAGHSKAPFVAEITTAGAVNVIRESATAPVSPEYLSTGRIVSFAGRDGRQVWAVYYPPKNAEFEAPAGEAPPLIVSAHGGPTGMADRGLKLKVQFWTSRGFAYLDVDYAGSWGYGRNYMESLNGKWGIADVEDVICAAEYLVEQGMANAEHLFISGGSAGGYTVLCALTFHNVFRAGASYYGIGDLNKLLELTHKFESGYIYALTGTSHGATEPVLSERSPLHHADQISVPVIFFQGGKDFVVPPDQSRDMVASLKKRGIPVEYFEFPEEGHGFRAADVISRCLDEEYAFYASLIGLHEEGSVA